MPIKEKKVSLFELFSDLIYVFAISRMTLLIEHPSGGVLTGAELFSYLIVSLVVLQAWLYMTNYVNRYGSWRWYDYLLASVNLTAAVYVSNTISPGWSTMQLPFNIGMLVMLLCVATLYLVQVVRAREDAGAARNSLLIISVVCLIYVAAIVSMLTGASQAVIWLDIAAVLTGAFLPFFIRGKFDIGIINYPHLVERFELLTIITFGEGIVGMTEYFDVSRLTVEPLLVFGILLTLYGSYVVQIHNMIEHHQQDRGLRLMFSHYGIVIGINVITVSLKLAARPAINVAFLATMTAVGLFLYFATVMVNAKGNKPEYRFSRRWLLPPALILTSACLLLFFTAAGTLLYLSVVFAASALMFGYYEYLYRARKQQSGHHPVAL